MIKTRFGSQRKSIYNENYYRVAAGIKNKAWFFGLNKFKKIANRSKSVLDCGCGDGSKLDKIIDQSVAKGSGIDLTESAIKKARNNYKKYNFKIGSVENLPFNDNCFDFVYSSYVLEHVENPEKVINEMIRVLNVNGMLGIICPNYGSPVFRSPCNKENIFKRFKNLTKRDLAFLSENFKDNLFWTKVNPIATKDNFSADWDTTIEPSLITLTKYLKNNGLEIIEKSSCWFSLSTPKPKVKRFAFLIKTITFLFLVP
jgi:SAM-dependent methyltransferase